VVKFDSFYLVLHYTQITPPFIFNFKCVNVGLAQLIVITYCLPYEQKEEGGMECKHPANQKPSVTTSPVMKFDFGEAINATNSATSSGSPTVPVAAREVNWFSDLAP
jgi:hypothetical protein